MNTTKRKKLDTKLTTNEFKLLCDLCNGSTFSLEHLNWKQNLFCSDEISELKNKWKVNPKNLAKKLGALSSLETLELLIKIQTFWKSDDSIYHQLNMVSPADKINEILARSDRTNISAWSFTGSIEDFYGICQDLEMDYVIYSQDTTGYCKEVWGVARENLFNSLSFLSSQHQFSNLQKLSDAILNGFKA